MTDSKSLTIREQGYEVRIEYNDKFVILHLMSALMSPTVYKNMVARLKEFWEFISTLGKDGIYVAIPEKNSKIMKLVHRLGFVYLGTSDNKFVYRYRG